MKKVTALIILSMFIILPLLAAGMAGTAFAADGNYLTGIDPSANAETLDDFPESMNPAPYSINLTPVFQAVIGLLAALITYRLVPWIKSRTTENQQRMFQSIVNTLVFAAEQLYGSGHGDEKLDYVCKQLKERGYEVDREEIEAAVYCLLHPHLDFVSEETAEVELHDSE